MLADTLSRRIEINNDVKQPAEEPGYEFGYTPFEELPAAQVEVVEEVIIAEDCGSEEVLLLHERPVKMEPQSRYQFQTTRWWNSKNRTSTSAS